VTKRAARDQSQRNFQKMDSFITGAHVIIGSSDAETDRAFVRDVLGLESVDAGGGWLIFGLPPAELAIHPGKDGRHELYLMCKDLDATLADLEGKGVEVKADVHDEPWGRLGTIVLPGGSELSIYQPRHPSPQPK
jgi:catechol 2,3-dioxygenase-like lactoylglutathione lyase family enzyme